VVLLANSDDFRRKPIGWLQRWFGGNEEQEGQPDMVLMVKRAKMRLMSQKVLRKIYVDADLFSIPPYPLKMQAS
jgi:hypothetical protein